LTGTLRGEGKKRKEEEEKEKMERWEVVEGNALK